VPFTKAELHAYAEHCRGKCRRLLEGLSEAEALRVCSFPWGELSYGELQLYNMRHVQEHASQLALFLGQRTGASPGWVSGVKRGGR
jgi:hypothetical protein